MTLRVLGIFNHFTREIEYKGTVVRILHYLRSSNNFIVIFEVLKIHF